MPRGHGRLLGARPDVINPAITPNPRRVDNNRTDSVDTTTGSVTEPGKVHVSVVHGQDDELTLLSATEAAALGAAFTRAANLVDRP